jgi:hypothetical protein
VSGYSRNINVNRRNNPQPWGDGEIDSIYVHPNERFVVSLIVGYGGPGQGEVRSPRRAAAAALDLTRDEGSNGTHWFVYDRKTGAMHLFEQDEFEDLCSYGSMAL